MARKAAAAVLALLFLAQPLAPASSGAGDDGGAGPRELDYRLPTAFLKAITPERISAVIEKLQSFGTRFAYSDRANEAAAYIASEFEAMNLSVRRQAFQYNGFENTNVLATLQGRNASLPALVLGAHHDSINGTGSLMNANAPAPGADDDASGVAAVLAIAGAFSRAGTERTVVFAAFANEEMGRIGSREFVRQGQLQKPGIYAGLCFDMIGYNHRYPKVDLVCNDASRWLADVVLEANRRNMVGVGAETVITPDNPQNWSDQVSFWEAGLPAMYFIEDENPTQDSAYFQANPYYHTGQDTMDKLNLTLITKVARLGAATAAALANLALPDLYMGDVARGIAFEGDNLTVIGEAFNEGAPGAYAFNVSLQVDGATVDRRSSNVKTRLYMSWTATRGTHTISVMADSDDRYFEWNETNNRFTFSIEIAVRPDVRIAGFWATDETPLPGQEVSLVALLENADGPLRDARVVIFANDGSKGYLLDWSVRMNPGELAVIVTELAAPSSPTGYTIMVSDLFPEEKVAENHSLSLAMVPDVLDRDDYRIVIEPDVVRTFDTVRVRVEGAPPGSGWYLDLGDGTGPGWTNAGTSHFYRTSGTRFISAVLRDAEGAVVTLETMPVTVQDRPPSAVIGGPDSASPGRPVRFSGAASRDPDGQVVQYLWDFGEGPKEFGAEVSHSFTAEKVYPVRLTVTDDKGQSATALVLVNVSNRPPVAKASASARLLFAGDASTFDGSASTDPDGLAVSCFWDFGDGTNATGPLAAHAFTKDGNYTVRLTVTDAGGAAATTVVNLTVLKKLRPLVPPPRPDNEYVVPAMLVVMLLIASVLVLRGRPARPRDEEE